MSLKQIRLSVVAFLSLSGIILFVESASVTAMAPQLYLCRLRARQLDQRPPVLDLAFWPYQVHVLEKSYAGAFLALE